jgi:stearoyl-CoA desaturase (delta-9 desaturase)
MNSYFYKIFLPHTMLSVSGVWLLTQDPSLLFWTLLFWIFIGPIGLGIGFHRLFSHRQFETYRPVELLLAFLGTIGAYGPLLFWVSSHQCHHRYTDTEKDPTSPCRGFWHSVITWNLKKQCEKEIYLKSYPSIIIMRDATLMWMTRNFFLINYAFLTLLFLLDFKIAIAGYVLATTVERLRIGFFVNYLLHKNIPFSYQAKDSTNNSINIFWLYPFTAGFSLHSQHHTKPMSLSEKTQWFEVDLEYFLCKFISKRNDKKINKE